MKYELPLRTMDVITCGSCSEEFLLPHISEFIQHKAFECPVNGQSDARVLDKVMICSSCRGQFQTSGALLRHVQDAHGLQLYTQEFVYESDHGLKDKSSYKKLCMSDRHEYSEDRSIRGWSADTEEHRVCSTKTEFGAFHSPGAIRERVTRSPEVTFQSQRVLAEGGRNIEVRHTNFTRKEESQVLPLDLKVSLRETVSAYKDIPSDSEHSTTSSVETSPSPRRCIPPKKRKWSNVEPLSDDCASPDAVTPSHSPRSIQDAPIGEISASAGNSFGNFQNLQYQPKWKYSVDVNSAVEVPTDLTDKRPNERTSDIDVGSTESFGVSQKSCTVISDREQSPEHEICSKLSNSLEVLVPERVNTNIQLTQYSPNQNVSSQKHYCAGTFVPEVAHSPSSVNDRSVSESGSDGTYGAARKRRYPTTRPFKCDFCEHSFNQRIHLKKHLSKHTGIKPFKCNLCDYSTVERSHLKVHVRIHTGEKPYRCSFCDYATAQNSTLKIHLKRHHGGQMFRCKVCGKGFTQLAMLGSHMTSHVEETTNH